MENTKIQTSVEFWSNFVKSKNYNEKGYDLAVTQYIKEKLDLPVKHTILNGLKVKAKKSEAIEIEDFIKVFFESLEPFSDMMVDLLNMFEEISAKQTDKNLEIEFAFDKGKSPTTVNLEKFKEYTATIKEIDKEYDIPDLDDEKLWELLKILKSHSDTMDSLKEHENDENWVSLFNELPIQKDSPLYIVYIIWKQIISELKSYKSKNEYLEDNSHKYYSIVSNNWVENIFNCLANLPEDNIPTKKLSNFFVGISTIKITLPEKLEKLEAFLKLPFWDKRYELYSVWVFSLIYRATKEHNLTVHTVDNKLIFPFKETHLATINCKKGNILIYSEKRTKLENPIGKYRTKNIQPDYSFFREPVTDTNSSILEIECKQYKKQGTRNFACALIDYAKGRDKADILLVNYGDINKDNLFKFEVEDGISINNTLDIKNRCDVIGILRPKNNEDKLINIIQKKVSKYMCKSFIFDVPFSVELHWEKSIKDLDLHLDFAYNGSIKRVSYKNKQIDNISLNEDIQEGSIEPEIISITKVVEGNYKFYVENYSNNYFDENVVCKILIDGKIIEEIRPENYDGKYWNLFEIDTIKEEFNIINNVFDESIEQHN